MDKKMKNVFGRVFTVGLVFVIFFVSSVLTSSPGAAQETRGLETSDHVQPAGQLDDLWQNGRAKLEEARERLREFQSRSAATLTKVEEVREWFTTGFSEFETFLKEFGANSELINTMNLLETEFSVRRDDMRRLSDSGAPGEVADEYRQMADGYDTLILELKDYAKALEKSRVNAFELLTRFAQQEELVVHRVRYRRAYETVQFLGQVVESFDAATKAWSDILEETPRNANPGMPN